MTRPPILPSPSIPQDALASNHLPLHSTPDNSSVLQNRILVPPTPSLSANTAGPLDPEISSDSYLAAVIVGISRPQSQKHDGQSQPAHHNPPPPTSLGHLPCLNAWSQDFSLDFPPAQSIALGPETQQAAESMERNSLWAHHQSQDSLILPPDSEPVFPSDLTLQSPPSPPHKSSRGHSQPGLSDVAAVSNGKQSQNSSQDALPGGQDSSAIEASIEQGPREQPGHQSSLKPIDVPYDQSQDSSFLDTEPSLPPRTRDPSGLLSPLPKRSTRHRDGGPIQSTCPNEDFPSPHPNVTLQLFKQNARLGPDRGPILSTCPNDDISFPHPDDSLELHKQTARLEPATNAHIPDSQALESSPLNQENGLLQPVHKPDQHKLSPPSPLRFVVQASSSAEHEMPDGRAKLPSNSSRSPTLSRVPSRASTDTSDRLRPLTGRKSPKLTTINPILDLSRTRPVNTSPSLPAADNIPMAESLENYIPIPETQMADPGPLPAVESDVVREPQQASESLGPSATTHEPNQQSRSVLVPETPAQVPNNLSRPQSPSERIGRSSRGAPLASVATTASLVSPQSVVCPAVVRTAAQKSQQAPRGPVRISAPAQKRNRLSATILAPETPAQVPCVLTRPQSPSERIGRPSRSGLPISAVATAPGVISDTVDHLIVERTGAEESQQASESWGPPAPAQTPTSKTSRPVLAPETWAQGSSAFSRSGSPERIRGSIRCGPSAATPASLRSYENAGRPAVGPDTAGGLPLDGVNPSNSLQANDRDGSGNGGQALLGKRKRTSHEQDLNRTTVSPGFPDATEAAQESHIRVASRGLGGNDSSGSLRAPMSYRKKTRTVSRSPRPIRSSAASVSIDRPTQGREQASPRTVAGPSRVAVVIPPRKQKAPARRAPGFPRFPSQANAPNHFPPPAMISHGPGEPFPVKRVLAYHLDSGVFSPGQVYSVTPNQVVVKFDDGMVEARELIKLRRCEIRVGDLVRYIGTDLADQESQFTAVREPKRVLRVELVAEDRSPGCHLRGDVVVCCNVEDYEGSVECSLIGDSFIGNYSRFLVEAIQVVPDGPRKHHGLSDRLLPKEACRRFEQLMKAHSGVGKRVKTATRRAQLTSAAAAISSPEHFFRGLGILITSGARTEARPPGRKKTVSFREMIERQIRERQGTVIDRVTELYELTSADEVGETAVATKGKQRARFDDDYEACQLRPAPKHQELRQIILVAETATKTFKYLMALALGIPCVSTRWVTDSYAQGSALDWEKYMIGPGPSAFLGGAQPLNNLQSRLVDRSAHDLFSIFKWRESMKIFNDKTFIYVSSKTKNKSEWAESIRPILCATGARKVKFMKVKKKLDEQGIKNKKTSTQKKKRTKKKKQININDDDHQGFDYVIVEDYEVQIGLNLVGSSKEKFKKTIGGNNDQKLVGGLRSRMVYLMGFVHDDDDLEVNNVVVNENDDDDDENLIMIKGDRVVDWEWVKECLIVGRIL